MYNNNFKYGFHDKVIILAIITFLKIKHIVVIVIIIVIIITIIIIVVIVIILLLLRITLSINQSILSKGNSFTANSRTKAVVLVKGRSSTANSGAQAAVLLGMDRCSSFTLLSAPHSLSHLKRL